MIQEHRDEINNQFKDSRQSLAAHCGYALAELHYKALLDKMAEGLRAFIDFPEDDLAGWIEQGRPVTMTIPISSILTAETLLTEYETFKQQTNGK